MVQLIKTLTMKDKPTTNQFNVGDKVEYKGQNATVVDHYGAGIYAVEINGNWIPVNEKELTENILLNENLNNN